MYKFLYNIRNRNLVFASISISLIVYIFYTDTLSYSTSPSTTNYELRQSDLEIFKIIPPPKKYSNSPGTHFDTDISVSRSFTEGGVITRTEEENTGVESPWGRDSYASVAPPIILTTGNGTAPREQVREPSKKEKTTTTSTKKKKQDEMSCHLPALNPFDKSILNFSIPPEPVNCTKDHPLLFTTDSESNLIQIEDPNKFLLRNCCYKSFTWMENTEFNVNLSDTCHPITSNVTKISSEFEFIQIDCENVTKLNNTEGTSPIRISTVDMFGFVHLKPTTEKHIEEVESKNSADEISLEDGDPNRTEVKRRKANVVILGLDANSHMNLMRAMPKSYAYLTHNLSALGLWGYTKVADNTFVNIVPVLTSLFVDELKKLCWEKSDSFFDDCPFIWKNYSSAGFRTSFAEDAIWMGIFSYQKMGFAHPPTDYYLHPLVNRLDTQIGHQNTYNCNPCYGPRLGFQVLLDHLKGMAATMKKDRRYFQFIWATSLFHDYLNNGKLGDEFLLETLRWFKTGGYLEDTVLILMSDHGIRWGGIRETLQGKLEERMPFLYFVLPQWFRDQYPAAVSSLVGNKHKLTTPFDLHETLQDLLHLDNIKSDKIRERHLSLQNWTKPKSSLNSSSTSNSTSNFPRGISLFLPIPLERTCADAEIADQWCVCRSMQSVPFENNTLVKEAARSLIHHINGMFIKFGQCETLHLQQILNAQVFHMTNDKIQDISASITDSKDPQLEKQQVTFSVSIRVEPSNATFEATTTRHTNGQWVISGEISRTNLYGDQSRCVTDYNLKKFCYCS